MTCKSSGWLGSASRSEIFNKRWCAVIWCFVVAWWYTMCVGVESIFVVLNDSRNPRSPSIFSVNKLEKLIWSYVGVLKWKNHSLLQLWAPVETINVNTSSDHIFSHFQNCSVSITYIMDPNSIPTIAPPHE